VTSIEPSLAKGLTLIADCEVVSIKENADGVKVEANKKQNKTKTPMTFSAKAIVVAAGSFGTTKILINSGFKHQRLGKGLACHPQYMTYALFDEPVDAFKGAFQGVKSSDQTLRKMGLKYENVFAPPIATAMLFNGFGIEHHKMMKKYRFLASMEVAIRDEAVGELRILNNGKMEIKKELTDQDRARARQGVEFVKEMYADLGTKGLMASDQGFGLHLMGGCAIGTDEKNSVVSPEFNVHGTKKIFIADSSIFPSAPGLNPSLTIMAMSHRAVPHIERAVV
jgi:choline dehydrogenase-like flavoprotein